MQRASIDTREVEELQLLRSAKYQVVTPDLPQSNLPDDSMSGRFWKGREELKHHVDEKPVPSSALSGRFKARNAKKTTGIT